MKMRQRRVREMHNWLKPYPNFTITAGRITEFTRRHKLYCNILSPKFSLRQR